MADDSADAVDRMRKGVPVKHPKDAKHTPETAQGVTEGGAKRNIVRHSRDPSRDKKQGGGHKGYWESTDDGTEVPMKALDRSDPNYDSADDAEIVLVDAAMGKSPSPEGAGKALMPLSDFKARVNDIIREFFVSEDFTEAKRSILELDSPLYHFDLVKRAISMSLDQKEKEKELISRLLSSLYPDLLTIEMVGKGFERLFEVADDLALDAPSAIRDISTFLARAVVDEILPPSFLSDPLIVGLGGDMVDNAKMMLSRDHMGARLERVWGPGDGRPVAELKVAVEQLLQEYLLSRQLEEAARCVRELSAPYFHHEIVKRGVVLSVDKPEEDRSAMASLLAYLYANEVVSSEQIRKGFNRLYEALPDLQLDAPDAPQILHKFVDQAKSDGCLPENFTPPAAPKA